MTANNVMRHAYRQLDAAEKADMQRVKDIGLEFYSFIENDLDYDGSPYDLRCLAIAKTKIEEAVMWATKAITK